MPYYCYLCDEDHEGAHTREHFIPQSMGAPPKQWLPSCAAENEAANAALDSPSRDILFLARSQHTGLLKRRGRALLGSGKIVSVKFSYDENPETFGFPYIIEEATKQNVPKEHIYAIRLRVGLSKEELIPYWRVLCRVTLGAIHYLLREDGVKHEHILETVRRPSIAAARTFVRGRGSAAFQLLMLPPDELTAMHQSCAKKNVRNHVVSINFREDGTIDVTGMLYSQYGWRRRFSGDRVVGPVKLRLENPLMDFQMKGPAKDVTWASDYFIVVLNDTWFRGTKPKMPADWEKAD